MITSDGLVKILDFGLAKLAASSASGELESRAQTATQQTEPGAVLGTVAYMSPEQAGGRSLDFRSDQFSLGVMLYEMASGLRPFHRATAVETLAAVFQAEPPALPLVNPAVPEALQTIVRRCLAKQPEGRYASTRDLTRDLVELRDRTESAPSLPPPSAKHGRRLAFAGGLLLLLVLAGAGLWIARRRAPSSGGDRSIAILPLQNFGG